MNQELPIKMHQKHSFDLLNTKDNRSSQSAKRLKGRDSPYRLYENLTHKNSSQSKEINLLQANYKRSNQYLQTSIEVQELNKSQYTRNRYYRIKTQVEKSIDLNQRIYPKINTQIQNKIEIQRNNHIALYNTSTSKANRLRMIKQNQGRDIQDSSNKWFFQSPIKEQLSTKINDCMGFTPQVNQNDFYLDKISKYNNQHKEINELRQNVDSNLLKKKSIFQQIQDLNQTKLDEIHLFKEEDYMKFSFGFQQNRIKSTKKFPKDVFYNDVRKAKKNLSIQ